jgi:uncharacterized protein (TIGR01777 family)
VLLRTGLVLDRAGGALPRLLPLFRLGLGGPLGSGEQGFSWIHGADTIAAIRFLAARAELDGPFNLTAPEPVSNAGFSRALGRALGRPVFVRVPAFLLRGVLGELASALLDGQYVLPRRLLAAGFAFRFPTLDGALADLLARG